MAMPNEAHSTIPRRFCYLNTEEEAFPVTVEVLEPRTLREWPTHRFLDPTERDPTNDTWDESEFDSVSLGMVAVYRRTANAVRVQLPFRHVDSQLAYILHGLRLQTLLALPPSRVSAITNQNSRDLRILRQSFSVSHKEFSRVREVMGLGGWLLREDTIDTMKLLGSISSLCDDVASIAEQILAFRRTFCLDGPTAVELSSIAVVDAAHEELFDIERLVRQLGPRQASLATQFGKLSEESGRGRDLAHVGAAMETLNTSLSTVTGVDVDFVRLHREVVSRARRQGTAAESGQHIVLRLSLAEELESLAQHFPALANVRGKGDDVEVVLPGCRIVLSANSIQTFGDLAGLEAYKERKMTAQAGKAGAAGGRMANTRRRRRRNQAPKKDS